MNTPPFLAYQTNMNTPRLLQYQTNMNTPFLPYQAAAGNDRSLSRPLMLRPVPSFVTAISVCLTVTRIPRRRHLYAMWRPRPIGNGLVWEDPQEPRGSAHRLLSGRPYLKSSWWRPNHCMMWPSGSCGSLGTPVASDAAFGFPSPPFMNSLPLPYPIWPPVDVH